ncbi:nucleotidyltransferase family protein [Sunxiuqinia sp. A32]|uniref:nucleotidyltransferase family protein n=1 Tax=Sunxiuqinia sp. A32 TaxID=3461496 RepID=UPI0040460B2C
MKAMIFAAGLGTRLQPITNNTPKALVKINDKTLLERCILKLKSSGFEDIIINVHHFADDIINFVQNLSIPNISISISDERNELLDTGGGLLKAKALLQDTDVILVMNVDILSDLNFQELINYHKKSNALATLVVRKRQSSRYLLFNTDGLLCGWENTKTGEQKVSRPTEIENAAKFAFSGIHVLSPKLLNLIEENGKFSIIDLYLRLAKKHSIKAYIDETSVWMDLGKYDQIEEAKRIVTKLDQTE